MKCVTPELPVLDAQAATGNGNVLLVEDYDVILLSFNTASNGNLTAKVQGSITDDAPTWADAQAADNQYDYLQIKDLEDASTIDGDEGFEVSGTDDHRQFEVNVNGIKWLNVRVTDYTAGNVTVKAKGFSR